MFYGNYFIRILVLVASVFLFMNHSTARAEKLFADNFEAGDLSHTENGCSWGASSGSESDRYKPVVSKDIARSGSYSLKFRYRKNDDRPTSEQSAWTEQRFELGKKLTTIYMLWYQYWPTGNEGNLGPKFRHVRGPYNNNKFLRLWDESYGSYKVKVGFSTYPAGDWGSSMIMGDEQLLTEYAHNTSGMSQYRPPAINFVTDNERGRWVPIMVHVTLDSGSGDAVMQVWRDGKLVIDKQNISNYPTGGIGNYIRNGYLMGWGQKFEEETYTYIDDIIISDTPIIKPKKVDVFVE